MIWETKKQKLTANKKFSQKGFRPSPHAHLAAIYGKNRLRTAVVCFTAEGTRTEQGQTPLAGVGYEMGHATPAGGKAQ